MADKLLIRRELVLAAVDVVDGQRHLGTIATYAWRWTCNRCLTTHWYLGWPGALAGACHHARLHEKMRY